MRVGTLVIAAALAGCAEPAGPVKPVSGTRLALRRFTFTLGGDLIDRTLVHDLDRDEDCAPKRWSDGLTYCTPPAGEIVYTDGQCLTPVARLPLDSTTLYAAEHGRDGQIARLYRIGAPFDSASSEVWHLVGGACVGSFPGDVAATFALADEQPRDAFAHITSVVRGGDRLQSVEDTSDDGLVLPSRYHDRTLAADCVQQPMPGAPTTPCVPIAAQPASYFADAACTQPVAEIAAITPPVAISYLDPSGCTTYAALGADVPSGALYSFDNCTPVQADPSHRYVAAGGVLDLAPLSRTIERGKIPTRIRLIDLDDGALTDSFVYDTMVGADCRPTLLGSSLLCVPDAAHAETLVRYTDAACNDHLDVAILSSLPCARPPAFVVDLSGTWRRIERPITETLYARVGAGCTPGVDGPNTVAVSLPIPLSQFEPVGISP